jgi:tetratricopeptide (TPR) repeat protein
MRLFLLLLIFSFQTFSQILKDPIAKNWIMDGLDKNYNFEFNLAEESFAKLQAKYPQSPAYSTLMQMMLYNQFAPIKDNPKAKSLFLFHLQKAVELSEKLIKKNENDPEAIFFMLSSLANLAAWQADNDEMMKAVNTARRAFPFMKKGMKQTEILPDFLFTTGLYNYYIEQYPDDHPLVKPFMIFFSDGNKKLGQQQLDLCSKKAVFTAVEANYYSVYINLKHETRPEKALVTIEQLLAKYPNNLLYKTRKAETFIALNRFEMALPIITELIKANGKVYPVAGNIFAGILEEKWKKNDKEAEILYRKALKVPVDIRYTQDYHAMAWLGLGRIALRASKKDLAKTNFKMAMKLSEYQSTTKEADKYLDSL